MSQNNIFKNILADSTNYFFVDYSISIGSNSNWSYPAWPSHLDHILITNELFDEFEQPESKVQTFTFEYEFDNGWIDYNQYISDHRPVGLKLKFNQ